MSNPQAPDPVSYPKITVAGKEYEIRLDISDVIALEKQGVDILRPVNYDVPGPDGKHQSILDRTFKILAQGIHAGISADELAKQVGLEGILDVVPKTTEAIKKVSAQIARVAATAPEAMPEPPSIQ
jgi:hypothetical protein